MFVSLFLFSQVRFADALVNARAQPKVLRAASFAQRNEMSHNWVQQGRLVMPRLAESVYL
jgi:hypothetical protein